MVALALIGVSVGGSAIACERLQEFDEITATITKEFYDQTFRGLDWPARVASYRKQVSCDSDERSLAASLNGLLSELHASHTGLYTRHDLEYWALESIFSRSLDKYPVAFSGIWPERHADRWHAKYVLEGSPAANAGVRAGDELVSVDARAFEPLVMPSDQVSTLVISSDGKQRREVRVRAETRSIQAFLLEASELSTNLLEVAQHKVGYFHLWAGTHERFLNALNATLATFEEARVDALLIDLRGGFGGAGLEYLVGIKESAGLRHVPKYFLIDDGVRSGKEWVSATIKIERLGTLIGSRTAGAFLAGAPRRFASGRYFLFLAVDAFTPPGIGPIEGIGVEPDVPVPPCRTYCAGSDPQLEKALKVIEEAFGRDG